MTGSFVSQRRVACNALSVASLALALCCAGCGAAEEPPSLDPPNILFAISDDQSWPHAGAYGDTNVSTPAFDRVAREGALFTHSFSAAPSCTPSRGAVLTGQAIWRLGEAGMLMGTFPPELDVFPRLLEDAGYDIGISTTLHRQRLGAGRLPSRRTNRVSDRPGLQRPQVRIGSRRHPRHRLRRELRAIPRRARGRQAFLLLVRRVRAASPLRKGRGPAQGQDH